MHQTPQSWVEEPEVEFQSEPPIASIYAWFKGICITVGITFAVCAGAVGVIIMEKAL